MKKPEIIRKARRQDAAGIAAIHVASWRRAYRNAMPADFLDNLSVARRTEMWQQWFEDAAGEVLVCEADGRMTGFIAYGQSRDDDALNDREAEIYAIYLAPEVWGRGIGSALMTEALTALREKHYESVTLWVLAENHRAIAFYEAGGFRADGAHKLEKIRGGIILNELRMRLHLIGTVRS